MADVFNSGNPRSLVLSSLFQETGDNAVMPPIIWDYASDDGWSRDDYPGRNTPLTSIDWQLRLGILLASDLWKLNNVVFNAVDGRIDYYGRGGSGDTTIKQRTLWFDIVPTLNANFFINYNQWLGVPPRFLPPAPTGTAIYPWKDFTQPINGWHPAWGYSINNPGYYITLSQKISTAGWLNPLPDPPLWGVFPTHYYDPSVWWKRATYLTPFLDKDVDVSLTFTGLTDVTTPVLVATLQPNQTSISLTLNNVADWFIADNNRSLVFASTIPGASVTISVYNPNQQKPATQGNLMWIENLPNGSVALSCQSPPHANDDAFIHVNVALGNVRTGTPPTIVPPRPVVMTQITPRLPYTH